MPILTDPDCEAGKHRNCDGTGYDEDADITVPCPCSCHQQGERND